MGIKKKVFYPGTFTVIVSALALVAELVDAADSKSVIRRDVGVRLSPRAPKIRDFPENFQEFSSPMWQILITTKQAYLESLSTIVEEECVSVSWVEIENPNAQWDSEEWFIEGHLLKEPNQADLRLKILLAAKALGREEPNVTIQMLPETDWLERMWEKFPPQEIGPFFIHGGQYTSVIPHDKIPIRLDAATAFGSGEHSTTAECMTALHDLSKEFKWQRPLDLGCGSGILSIGACKLHPAQTLAIDNDTEAVRVTTCNAALNNVSDLIKVKHGHGLEGIKDSFDLIIANILAKPLISMAPAIDRHLDKGGYIILSGLLDWQHEEVEKAYLDQKFNLVRSYNLNRWITLVLKK